MAFTKTIIINIKTLIQCWVSMATNEDELNYSTNTCLIVNSFRSIRTYRNQRSGLGLGYGGFKNLKPSSPGFYQNAQFSVTLYHTAQIV